MASSTPHDIKSKHQPTGVQFHPEKPIIAVADINGKITLYSYADGMEPSELRVMENHSKSVRCLKLTDDGSHLFSGSKDKSWCHVDLESGQTLVTQAKAHESPLYSMEVVNKFSFVTADEDGCIKMWDTRRLPRPVMEMKENDDFISSMVCHSDRKHLLATSGDGSLTCYNIKKKSVVLQSEVFDSELLSLAIVKGGSKVVCGDGDGSLQIFNWGEWGNISDRYPGHPESVDTMIPVSEDFICTGCMDGKIRLVHILPNSIEKTIGSHGDFPVESLSLSCDGELLASSSHDPFVKFWRTPDLDDMHVDSHKKRSAKGVAHHSKMAERQAFFEDLG